MMIVMFLLGLVDSRHRPHSIYKLLHPRTRANCDSTGTRSSLQKNTGLLLLGITMLAGLPAVGMGTYIAYLGNRIRVTGQIPPPGTRVIVDTHVIKGTPAKVRGAICMVLGGLVIVCGLGLPIVAWRLIQTF